MIARHDPTTDTAAFRILGHENTKEPRADRDGTKRLVEAMRRFEATRLAWAAVRVAAARAERRAEAARRGGRACAAEVATARVAARRLRREADRLFAELSALAVEAAAAAEAVARKAH